MWRLQRLRLFLVACCAALMLSSVARATEDTNTGAENVPAADSAHHDSGNTPEEDSDWEYLRRFYEPAEKRAYSYVSEFKRLPVYNFGLGKRAGNPSDGRLYAFGLGKREKGMRQYSFGLGKRPSNSLYSFGLGKRSMDYSDTDTADEMFEDSSEDLDDIEDEDMNEDKRGGARQYSFGLGKRYNPRGAYSFGLGKRGGSMYSFGLGKRAPRYSFGLGKRLPSNRQYSFGLGKREISADELAAVAAEATTESSTSVPHTIRRRSAGSEEQAEWADAETPRQPTGQEPRVDDGFGRAGRRTYSFGLGKRLPALYSFGVGKRQPALLR